MRFHLSLPHLNDRLFALLLFLMALLPVHADTIILHLKSGDRIAGTIVSEDTNRVVITNSWAKELSIPLGEIVRREAPPVAAVPAPATTNAPATPVPTPPPAATNAPPPVVTAAAPPPATNTPAPVPTPAPAPPTPSVAAPPAATNPPVAATPPKPATPAPPPATAVPTNVLPSAKPGTPVAIPSPPPPKPKTPGPKYWKAEVKVGADFLFGAKEQEIFYGRFKLVYEHPNKANPKKFFRNIFDYSVDYGRTETPNSTTKPVVSANKMDGSDKTDFDIGIGKVFIYNLMGVGYDEIRKIDLHYELGPGLGYHALALTNFVLNSELGFNYQVQERADKTHTEKFYFRLAEDITWKINKTITFTQKAEFFPQVENLGEYRARAEATLSYGFWQNLSLNLSLLDLYDTQPAKNVPNNDLQIRSSLGITF